MEGDYTIEDEVKDLVNYVINSEINLVNWLFQDGHLVFEVNGKVRGILKSEEVQHFVLDRVNRSISQIFPDMFLFSTDKDIIKKFDWFYEELNMTKDVDFFPKKDPSYTKRDKPISEDDLF